MHPTVAKIENNAWRDLMHRLLTAQSTEAATPIIDELNKIVRGRLPPPWNDLLIRDAARLIELAMVVAFPEHSYKSTPVDRNLLFMCTAFEHGLLAKVVYLHFPKCKEHLRTTALAVMAAQGTAEGYQLLGRLLERHQLGRLQPRFFTEVTRHIEHLELLVPGLLSLADKQLGEVMNLINLGIAKGLVTGELFAGLEDRARTRFDELRAEVSKGYQQGLQPNLDEEFGDAVNELGPWIDVLGYLGYDETLERAFAELPFGYLRSCALATIIRWKRAPSDALIHSIAADPLERSGLFTLLASTGLATRFPRRYLNFESFAAADMAQWIERDCGVAPLALNLDSIHRAEMEGDGSHLCLWKFSIKDATSMSFAGISGAYSDADRTGQRPIYGSDTFSTFEPWDAQTPQQHAQHALDVLAQWRSR